jgi:predicted HD superfamily hydrolase involved in NAD metabolism
MVYTENKEGTIPESVDLEKIKLKLKAILPEQRYLHSLGTKEKAVELAQTFEVDPHRAAIAGLLHDCARYMTKDQTFQFVLDKNIAVAPEYFNSPSTLHAFAGEYIAYHEFGIRDERVLKAIRNHTLGDIDMSKLDKIIYIADKIEERTRVAEHFVMIREKLAETCDLDEAILLSYAQTITGLTKKKYYINPQTIRNWNYILQKTGKIQEYEGYIEIYLNGNNGANGDGIPL